MIYKYKDDRLEILEILDCESKARKLQWNVLGNIIYASFDDNHIRIYKQHFNGKWIEFDNINNAPM